MARVPMTGSLPSVIMLGTMALIALWLTSKNYFPGLITSPLVALSGLVLLVQLRRVTV